MLMKAHEMAERHNKTGATPTPPTENLRAAQLRAWMWSARDNQRLQNGWNRLKSEIMEELRKNKN